MSIVLGLWHLTLEGGQEKTVELPAHVQITNISLGEEIVDQGRTVVKLTFEPPIQQNDSNEEDEDEDGKDDDISLDTTVLCALTPGKIEHAIINVTLDGETAFIFTATGKNKVHLTGNYIRQMDDAEPSDSEGSFDSDDEDAYDLREVSSDVEMHPDDLDGFESDASRFEEVDDEPAKASKRPRESDVADEQKAESAGKKTKKLKAEGGKAVSAPDTDATPKAEKQDKKKKDKKTEGAEKAQRAPEEGKEKKEGKGDKAAKKTIAGGVVIQDVKVGTGPQAKKGNTVRMRYIGKLTNGKVFDKNVSGKPFTFHLGKGEVIKGWDEGIVGMQVGGERILSIPPNMAYGSKKQEGIPANSTLVFEVKLLEIK